MELPFDFNNRRVISIDGGDDSALTLTTVQDVANVVAKAIDYEGEWPVIGGIRGTTISTKKLIALGEKIRGTFVSFYDRCKCANVTWLRRYTFCHGETKGSRSRKWNMDDFVATKA
jgi:hypothetical protein